MTTTEHSAAPGMPQTPAKAVTAAVGTTLVALTTALAAVQLAIEDGSLGFDEYGSVTLAVLTAALTIYGVWRVPNRSTASGGEIPPYDRGSSLPGGFVTPIPSKDAGLGISDDPYTGSGRHHPDYPR